MKKSSLKMKAVVALSTMLFAGSASANSLTLGDVLTPATFDFNTGNFFDIYLTGNPGLPSFSRYFEVLAPADANILATFRFIDTDPDSHVVSYSLWTDGDGDVGESDLGSLVGSIHNWTDTNATTYSFSQLLLASAQYVLKIDANPGTASVSGNVSGVPLPAAALLFGSAVLGAGALRSRKQEVVAA